MLSILPPTEHTNRVHYALHFVTKLDTNRDHYAVKFATKLKAIMSPCRHVFCDHYALKFLDTSTQIVTIMLSYTHFVTIMLSILPPS